MARICTHCQRRYPSTVTSCPFDGKPLIEAIESHPGTRPLPAPSDPGWRFVTEAGDPSTAGTGGPGPAASADADIPLTGRVLGNFRIESVLGQGGMGAVYLARHVALGTRAVVKVMLRELAKNPRDAQRFLNEARLGSSLNHPNVVRIFDYGQLADNAPYMVMEYVEGDDLHVAIRREGRIEPVRAARILRQVASALEAAHAREGGSIIHRDLKPANIRLSVRGGTEHVTVLDFGIARVVEDDGDAGSRLTLPGTLVGTPAYMSPEQGMGEPLDGRSDIYALGVVAYEMLTGRLPFESPRSVQLIAMHVQQRPPPIPDDLGIPHQLAALVMRCLEKLPAGRPQTCRELIIELDAFIALATARPPGRKLALVLVAAIAALTAGTLAVALRRAPPPAATGKLTALSAAGRDLTADGTFYTAATSIRLEGTVELRGPWAEAEVTLERVGGQVLARGPIDGQGRFSLAAALEPGERAALDLVLRPRGAGDGAGAGAGGGAAASGQVVLANRTIVCDVRPPRLRLASGAGGAVDEGGATVYARRSRLRLAVEVEEDVGLAPGGLRAEVAEPARAAIVAGPAGPELDLDLGDLHGGEPPSVTIEAADLAGNRGRARYRVLLDLSEPSVVIAAVGGERVRPGSAPLEVVGAAGAGEQLLPVDAVVADDGGLAAIELDAEGPGGLVPPRPPDGRREAAGAVEARFLLPVPGPGRYALRVTARDRAGNAAEARLELWVRRGLEVEVAVAAAEGGEPRAVGAGAERAEPLHVRGEAIAVLVRANQALELATALLGAEGVAIGEPVALDLDAERRTGRARIALRAASAQRLVLSFTGRESGARAVERAVDLVQDGTPPTVVIEGAPWPSVLGGGSPGLADKTLAVRARAEDAHLGPLARVRFAAEPVAERAAALAAALARGDDPPGVSSVEAPIGPDGWIEARVPVVDGARVVVAVEALDRAGNRGAAAALAAVDLRAPGFAPLGRSRFRVHEPIEVVIQADEPVTRLLVRGAADGLSAGEAGRYVFRAGTMLLDTPLGLEVEAVDAAGNVGRAELRLEREAACAHSGKPYPDSLVQKVLDGSARPFCPFCRSGQEPLTRAAAGER